MFIPLLKDFRILSPFAASLVTCTCKHEWHSRLAPQIRRILVGLFVLCVFPVHGGTNPAHAQAVIIINISGDLTESQRRNILSHLSLARLRENEPLSEALFNRLYGKVEKETATALAPFGYYTPHISLSHHRENGSRRLDLVVATGPPVTIRQIQITLTGPGKEDTALREAVQRFPIQPNDILDHQRYEEAKTKLITTALDNGYLKATFRNNRVEIQKKALSASMHLQLDTGPRYEFGALTFTADFIDHALLRKISSVKEGDPLSPRALTRLRQSLFNADYFSSVELAYNIDQTPTPQVPVQVILTPNLAHKYGVGLGYGTDTGPRGTLEYTNRHINRFGHQLDIRAQPSQRKSSFGGVYTIPVGDPRRDRLSILGNYGIENFAGTDSTNWTATISRDYFRERGEYSAYLQFLDEQYSSGAETGHAALFIPGVKGTAFWTDNRIATTRGFRISTSLIGSQEGLMATTSFLQTAVRAKGIYSFFNKWRWIGRGDFGITLTDDLDDLPPSLRYYAGGDQSVRGYGYKQIGPVDANGTVIGGKNLLTYSVELERVLFDDWSGALFYDSGTATNSFSNLTLRSGAGIGVRWNAPFGQIRLDLAHPLDNSEGSWRIHFTLGADL